MSTPADPRDKALLDFSGLFGELLHQLRVLTVGVSALHSAADRANARFYTYAANPTETLVQNTNGANGTIRQIHNASGVPVTVLIVDGMESNIIGSPGFPITVAPGAFVPGVYAPFKDGLRATVIGGGFIAIGGDRSS